MKTHFPSSIKNIGVAIVAPSGYVDDDAAIARAYAQLESIGCKVHPYYDLSKGVHRFAGTVEACKANMDAALRDPEVKIIMSLRGGYGMSRLLPILDFKKIADSGKLFIGHSDFTALQMGLLAQTGAPSFAGPMLYPDFGAEVISTFTMQNFISCLSKDTHHINVAVKNNPVISVAGILWGGNLAVLNALLGTPYFPSMHQGILFLEDINEHPYRVERMLLQLLQAGVLEQQKAVVLGDFSKYTLTDYDRGYDFNAMLSYVRSQVSTPILTGLPFGHIADKLTLPIGARAYVQSDSKSLQLTVSAYPNLS